MPKPLKYGEPMERCEFRFPASQMFALHREARLSGRTLSDIVRDAVAAKVPPVRGDQQQAA